MNIVQPGTKILTPEVELLEQSKTNITVEINEQFEWMLNLYNKGQIKWPESIMLSGISGQFVDRCNFKFRFSPPVEPQTSIKIFMNLLPIQLTDSEQCLFQLSYENEDGIFVPFVGGIFSFQMQVTEVKPQELTCKTKRQYEIQEKANEAWLLQKDIPGMLEFIKRQDPKDIDEIVECLLKLKNNK